MTKLTPEGRFPVPALIAEAQRELDLRRQFYWARVRAGKMRRADDEGPDLDAAEAACLAACGEGMTPAAKVAITATAATIGAWLAAGYDLELDVLPVIAERMAKPRGSPIRTWEYFSQAIAARHARRIAQAARPKDAGEAGAGPAVAPGGQTVSPEDRLARLAAWLNSGAYVPPSAVTNTQRDALLRAGLVTEATLRAHQIY